MGRIRVDPDSPELREPVRVIVATDRRLLICRGDRWRKKVLSEVLSEYSRQTTIGPARGLWFHADAFGERIYINRSSFDEIAKADDALTTSG